MASKALISIVLLALLVGVLINYVEPGITGFTIKNPSVPPETGSISVYFCPMDGCEQKVVDEILASSQVLCALYDLDLEKIRSALQAGDADVLIDEDNFDGYGQEISGSGLMHNKFCVLDSKKIITGSFNPTFRGANMNNNNLLIIESKYLAENYRREFFDIKNGKDSATPYPKVMLNNILIENYFCPSDKCEENVLRILSSAEKSVYFMAFSFTSDPIGDFLISKKDSLEIKGVFEKSQNNDWTEYKKMADAGMDVKFDSNKANMHHKVFIVDNKTVITGSYNPTANGNKNNDENILVIHDSSISVRYLEEFRLVYGAG